jgi:hypothetical protein
MPCHEKMIEKHDINPETMDNFYFVAEVFENIEKAKVICRLNPGTNHKHENIII